MGAALVRAFIDSDFRALLPDKECIMAVRAEESGIIVFAISLV